MHSSSVVLVDAPHPGCALVTLNRPQALNALSAELRRGLVQVLAALAQDPSLRAVVLTGAGRAFCAGLDLEEIGEQGVPPAGAADDPVAGVRGVPQPGHGASNRHGGTGRVGGGGACDVLIGSSAARFADTHARIGVLPGWGLSQKLGVWAAEGKSLTADES